MPSGQEKAPHCIIDCSETYLAHCECGWRGWVQPTRHLAKLEASEHMQKVHDYRSFRKAREEEAAR